MYAIITVLPTPDFGLDRNMYPFGAMKSNTCYLAGTVKEAAAIRLKCHLYTAIHTRKEKSPTEDYKVNTPNNGDVYSWRTA